MLQIMINADTKYASSYLFCNFETKRGHLRTKHIFEMYNYLKLTSYFLVDIKFKSFLSQQLP